LQVIKLYAWEPSFEAKITLVRNKEMAVIRKSWYYRAVQIFSWTVLPFLVSKDWCALPSFGRSELLLKICHEFPVNFRLGDCHHIWSLCRAERGSLTKARGSLRVVIAVQHPQGTAESPSHAYILHGHGKHVVQLRFFKRLVALALATSLVQNVAKCARHPVAAAIVCCAHVLALDEVST